MDDKALAEAMTALGAHLARWPYLGLDHPVGRRIETAVRRAPKVTLRDAVWYRGRLPDGPELRAASQMGPPPATWTEGRFNHHGQTVFYLASTAYGACAETAPAPRCILWVQRFRVRQFRGLLDLADVTGAGGRAGANIALLTAGLNAVMDRLRPDPGSPWKPEYFVPRFVADAARAAGFRGILYCSTRCAGYNAVLFEWTRAEVVPEGRPAIAQFAAGRDLSVLERGRSPAWARTPEGEPRPARQGRSARKRPGA